MKSKQEPGKAKRLIGQGSEVNGVKDELHASGA